MDIISIVSAAEAVEPTGVAGALGLDVRLFLAQLINFGLLATLLWYLLFRPLTKHMADRSSRIAEGLAGAERAKQELETVAVTRERIMAEAKEKAAALLTKADDEAKRIIAASVVDAEKKADSIKERTAVELTAAKAQLLVEVRNSAADLVVLAAEKALRGTIDVKLDKKLVTEVLKETRV
ncbi:MAG: F0F1 ATP synthase subunit B [Patescibacteria group bacterium]|jgi:F-type H+-transporting ATPase subunit b